MIKLSNKRYDTLKYICQIVLPGIGTLWFTISQIWSLPYGEEIVGTITAITAFLGIVLGISSSNYDKMVEKSDTDMEEEVGKHYERN